MTKGWRKKKKKKKKKEEEKEEEEEEEKEVKDVLEQIVLLSLICLWVADLPAAATKESGYLFEGFVLGFGNYLVGEDPEKG